MSTNIPVTQIGTVVTTPPATAVGTVFPAAVAGAGATTFSFFNDGRVVLLVTNTDTQTDCVLTFDNIGSSVGILAPDMTVDIPASDAANSLGRILIGPFPLGAFNQVTGADVGKVTFTVTAGTDKTLLKFHVLTLPS